MKALAVLQDVIGFFPHKKMTVEFREYLSVVCVNDIPFTTLYRSESTENTFCFQISRNRHEEVKRVAAGNHFYYALYCGSNGFCFVQNDEVESFFEINKSHNGEDVDSLHLYVEAKKGCAFRVFVKAGKKTGVRFGEMIRKRNFEPTLNVRSDNFKLDIVKRA